MKITIDGYFKKEEEVKDLIKKIEDLKLKAKDFDSLKKNREYKKFTDDLKLKKEQLEIMRKRIGPEKIGQAFMDRNPLIIIRK